MEERARRNFADEFRANTAALVRGGERRRGAVSPKWPGPRPDRVGRPTLGSAGRHRVGRGREGALTTEELQEVQRLRKETECSARSVRS